MREVVIASAARTPIGNYGGTLKDTAAVALGAIAVKEAIRHKHVNGIVFFEILRGVEISDSVFYATET